MGGYIFKQQSSRRAPSRLCGIEGGGGGVRGVAGAAALGRVGGDRPPSSIDEQDVPPQGWGAQGL